MMIQLGRKIHRNISLFMAYLFTPGDSENSSLNLGYLNCDIKMYGVVACICNSSNVEAEITGFLGFTDRQPL